MAALAHGCLSQTDQEHCATEFQPARQGYYPQSAADVLVTTATLHQLHTAPLLLLVQYPDVRNTYLWPIGQLLVMSPL